MSPQSIQNAVAEGWPIEYFDGSEKDLANLARFVSSRKDMALRLKPVNKTELVFPAGRKAAAKTAKPVENQLELTKRLVALGASFQVASAMVEADAKSVKKVEGITDILPLLNLDGRASGKAIYEAIRA